MDEQNVYNKFNEFLTGFFIRKAEGTLTNDDFDEKQWQNIRPYLEDILSRLSLPEAIRVQTYFNEALNFHIKALGQPTQTSLQKSPASRSIRASFNSELQPFKRSKLVEADTPKESSQEETPQEGIASTRRKTAGMMQSTPLSMPTLAGNQMRPNVEQAEYASAQEDLFVNDIITHINFSPIPQAVENQPILSEGNVNTFTQLNPSSIQYMEEHEHPFLQNFAHLMEKGNRTKNNRFKEQSKSLKKTNTAGTSLHPSPKTKRKKVPFEVLCCWRPKEVNQAAEYSFLYFPLMPRKMRNLIKRVTGSARTGRNQSLTSKEKLINLSNVMRAYASERQSSVELPAQVSFLPSPCTPQGILRTSQLQPFTPIRGDGTSHLLGLETEQSNLQTRPVLRQLPLFTIPERDSFIQKPTGSPNEDVLFGNSLSSISQLPENAFANQLDIDENIHLASIAENVEGINLEAQPSIHIGSPNLLPTFIEQHELSEQNESIVQDNMVAQIHNQVDDAHLNWFDILRPRLDILYPTVDGERRRKRKKRKRNIEEEIPSCRSPQIQEVPSANSSALPMITNYISEQITQYPVPSNPTQLEHGLRAYINLLKEGIKNRERTWEHFDPFLFSENDDFEMYTHIFKRMLTEDFVSMGTLYNEGTSRLDAAKGFRLLLELQTMGLIEFVATGTNIESFKYRSFNDLEGS